MNSYGLCLLKFSLYLLSAIEIFGVLVFWENVQILNLFWFDIIAVYVFLAILQITIEPVIERFHICMNRHVVRDSIICTLACDLLSLVSYVPVFFCSIDDSNHISFINPNFSVKIFFVCGFVFYHAVVLIVGWHHNRAVSKESF